ncbi:MAG: hypothetical protein IJP66_07230, partial [Kiritimatiellae bacterium]|nr:hypothetical protein [Kiritimatiellia bacterium]
PLLVVAELHTPSATNVIRCSFPSPPPANSAETPTGTPDDTATIVVDDSPVAAVAPASALATLRAAAVAPALAISRSLGSFALRDILSIEVRRDDGSSQRFDFAPDGSMAIAGDDAGGEPISDAEEIASRIAAMADFLSAIQADAAAIPPKTDVLPPPPRITVEIEPRDPQAPHLTLMFRATNADAGTVSVTTSQGIDCPEYIFPAKIAEIFSRNFRESYHQPLRTSP